jgi:hypothetical protein
VDAFAELFQPVYKNPSPGVFPSLAFTSEFLFSAPIFNSNIFKNVNLRDYPNLSVITTSLALF